jgi:hypothetical protein
MPGKLPDHTILESISHEKRGTTVVTVGDLGNFHDDEVNHLPLADVIRQLQDVMDSIPEDFRKTAVLSIGVYGECAGASADILFLRPETDAEMVDRRRWLASIDQESEERDRAAFERIKDKYG